MSHSGDRTLMPHSYDKTRDNFYAPLKQSWDSDLRDAIVSNDSPSCTLPTHRNALLNDLRCLVWTETTLTISTANTTPPPP